MTIGEAVLEKDIFSRKNLLALSLFLLMCEITFVKSKCHPSADTSMYFILPFTVAFLLGVAKKFTPSLRSSFFRGASTAIYVMQYGVIFMVGKALGMTTVSKMDAALILYFSVIIIGCCSFKISEKLKLDKLFF